MNDSKVLMALSAGVVSTIIAELGSRILRLFGIGSYSVYELNSFLVTINRPDEIMGLIVNFITGGTVSVISYLAFKKWGYRYIVIKCLLVGWIMWILWEGFFTSSIEGKYIPIRPLGDYYVHLAGTTAFGASMGLLLKLFVFKNTVSSRNKSQALR